MTKFKTHYNSVPDIGEVNNGKSMTIPDQSLSVRDIMRRYASGLGYSNVKVGEYQTDEEDLPDFKKMDLSEIHDFKKYVSDNLREKQRVVTEQMEERKKSQTLEMYNRWKAEEEAKKSKEVKNIETEES